MAGRMVTVYVDDASLRLLVAKGKRVEKWAELPLEPGLVKDGVIVNQEQVAARLRQLLDTQKVKATRVVAALSGLHCLSRLITLPRLSGALLAEGVKSEAERVIPVPLEQLYLSWQVISTPGEQMLVFLVAFPRNATDTLIQTLHAAALDPYLVDLKPLVLARLASSATAIIADVQPTDIDIVVLVDRVPQLIRTLSLPHEAESWPEKLNIIKEELDRTTKFYNSSHSESPLDPNVPVFASGELAQHPESCESLTADLGYPVSPLSSPLGYPQDFPTSQYMVNIGLALKEVSPRSKASSSVVNFNALPGVYLPKQRSLSEFLPVPSIVVAVSLLGFLGMLVWNGAADVNALQTQLDTTNRLLEQRLAQVQMQLKDITGLESSISQAKVSRDAFQTALLYVNGQSTQVNGGLSVAVSALPSTMQLTGVTYSGSGLVVGGVAPSEDAVLSYARELRARQFSQVIISTISKGTEDSVSFSLTLIR